MNSRPLPYLAFTSLLLILTWLPFNAHADADLEVRQKMAIRIAQAWQEEDFGTLEAMASRYLDPAQRTPSGKRLLAVYEQYLDSFISLQPAQDLLAAFIQQKPIDNSESINGPAPSLYPEKEREWKKVEAKIDRWEKAYPASPNPKLARATYYTNKGQYFRGSRWASQVQAEAWPIYRENLNAAHRILLETQSVSRQNPMWFSLMFGTLGARSAPRAEVDALIADTLKNGQGYQNALNIAFHYMQPRWGGSYQQMDRFARQANKATEKQENGEIYARLYWNLVSGQPSEMNHEFFDRTGASWPLLKDSFERMVRMYPEPRNLSGYAVFACMANDTEGARQLLRRAGTLVYIRSWPRDLQKACIPD